MCYNHHMREFFERQKEFKENYEGLKNIPNLISIDGPDGVGKTSIVNKVIEILKEKFKEEGKDEDDIVRVKYTRYNDTESLERLTDLIRKSGKDGSWDKDKIDHISKVWSAKLNRSYEDHIKPMLAEGKIVILDRSELDLIRACLEWDNQELLEKAINNLKEGALTMGIAPGNRIFVSSSPEDIWANLEERRIKENTKPSFNDPKNEQEVIIRVEKETKAEEITEQIHKPNIIRVTNKRQEENKEEQIEEIAKEIVNNLKI